MKKQNKEDKIGSICTKLFNNKKIFIITILLVFILILLLNIFTPLLADDYSYSFGLNGRLKSLKDVLDYQVHHWETWGGRSVAHSIAQIFLMTPKMVFNIFNSIVYVIFSLLMYKHIVGKEKKYDIILYLIINLAVWFVLPVYGQNIIWLIGSCNYLWCTTIVLAFLLPFRLSIDEKEGSKNIFKIIIMLLLGIIAGWTNENTAAAMLLAIIIFIGYKIYNKNKVSLWYYSGLIGSIAGFLMMILAPGNSIRSEQFKTNRGPIGELIHRFFEITNNFVGYLLPLLIIFIIITIFSHFYGENKKKHLIKTIIFLVLSFAGAYSMILSPTFPERSWMAPSIFLILATGYSLNLINKKEKITQVLVVAVIPLLILAFLFNYRTAFKDTRKVNREWKDRINYIEEEKRKGNLDLIVKKIVPIDRHVGLYLLNDLNKDTKIWPNNSIARYFEINSIKIED